jgi:hypothetical protein
MMHGSMNIKSIKDTSHCHTAVTYFDPDQLYYEGNSVSKLQIQVATYIFELSAGNCHCYIAALSSFIATHNDQCAHDCTDIAAVKRWQRP